MDPAVIAALIGAGVNLFGGITSGVAKAADAKEQQREFNLQYGLTSGQSAMGAQRSIDSAPLRDKAAYLMSQRMGWTPQAFQPHSMYMPGSPTTPQFGGIPSSNWAQANANYTPGAGGVTTGAQQEFLKRIGWPVANSGTGWAAASPSYGGIVR